MEVGVGVFVGTRVGVSVGMGVGVGVAVLNNVNEVAISVGKGGVEVDSAELVICVAVCSITGVGVGALHPVIANRKKIKIVVGVIVRICIT